jgi:hypothetical protein
VEEVGNHRDHEIVQSVAQGGVAPVEESGSCIVYEDSVRNFKNHSSPTNKCGFKPFKCTVGADCKPSRPIDLYTRD